MNLRTALLLVVFLGTSLGSSGCSRASDPPQPRAVAELKPDASAPPKDSSSAAAREAPVPTNAEPASAFAIVARAPMGSMPRLEAPREIAMPLPLLQRLPNGGLVVASEYARAQAAGPGALAVELHGKGFEVDIAYRHGEVQGAQAVRWIWSDASLTIVSREEATMRSGPRVTSYTLGPTGFAARGGNVGYWSAVMRSGSALALERVAYEVPNSGAYPKGSPYQQNEWKLRAARVAVLSGKAAAPMIPPGVCPVAMSAAPDGTVVIAVDKCSYEDQTVGVLRYPPPLTQAKVEWLAARPSPRQERPEVVVAAARDNEIYVADGAQLRAWDGKAWNDAPAPSTQDIVSLSCGLDGALWAATKDGRVTKRATKSAIWSDVALPRAPADALEDHGYSAPALQGQSHFVKDAASEYESYPSPAASALSARVVDAAGDEILVLAHVGGEAFVLSTKARSPVARLPSIATQRARLMQTFKPEMMTAKTKYCSSTFLMFGEGTTLDAIRAKLGPSPADAGSAPKIGEAIVEGKKQLVVYGEEPEIVVAAKALAPLSPQRACSPAVIERSL